MLAVVKRPGTLNAPTAARVVARPGVVPVGQSARRPDLGTAAKEQISIYNGGGCTDLVPPTFVFNDDACEDEQFTTVFVP